MMDLKLFLFMAIAILLTLTSAAPTSNTSPVIRSSDISIPQSNHLEKRLGVAVDLCHDINFQNCDRNVHIDDRRCYFLNPDQFGGSKGLSSVGFGGHMWCTLYSTFDCHGSEITLRGEARDLRNLGFNNVAMGILCHRDD
ncbi:hypothetical protein EJ08DRAFT_739216 [Tothia fuscella]|uniref:Uncharacterized protein n=1 Tax=Tothia fuscella TaxID=1048955 RepID=A0A9P4NEV6_9PEZI|nr:hypothetical protein EJ08DRAFT_739216 [Tothia fuscella]